MNNTATIKLGLKVFQVVSMESGRMHLRDERSKDFVLKQSRDKESCWVLFPFGATRLAQYTAYHRSSKDGTWARGFDGVSP